MNQFYVKQFPSLTTEAINGANLQNHLLELIYTSWDLADFAESLSYLGAPFRWDLDRRAQLRAEIDAAVFKYLKLDRSEVSHVLDAFPIVERSDTSEFGRYRTKELILDAYDRMTTATKAGVPYESQIDPPPADPSLAHPLSASR